jgi:hypothetical protein
MVVVPGGAGAALVVVIISLVRTRVVSVMLVWVWKVVLCVIIHGGDGDGTKHEHAVLISASTNLARKKVGVTRGLATQVVETRAGAGARFGFSPGCDTCQIPTFCSM